MTPGSVPCRACLAQACGPACRPCARAGPRAARTRRTMSTLGERSHAAHGFEAHNHPTPTSLLLQGAWQAGNTPSKQASKHRRIQPLALQAGCLVQLLHVRAVNAMAAGSLLLGLAWAGGRARTLACQGQRCPASVVRPPPAGRTTRRHGTALWPTRTTCTWARRRRRLATSPQVERRRCWRARHTHWPLLTQVQVVTVSTLHASGVCHGLLRHMGDLQGPVLVVEGACQARLLVHSRAGLRGKRVASVCAVQHGACMHACMHALPDCLRAHQRDVIHMACVRGAPCRAVLYPRPRLRRPGATPPLQRGGPT